MGFTPLEGLVMATRSGSVDPGLLLWLQTHAGLTPDEVRDALERRSGLLGWPGSADMREVIAGVDAATPDARLAFDVYVHRLASLIAAMAASAGGLDALVFTGGVGEQASAVRRAAAERSGVPRRRSRRLREREQTGRPIARSVPVMPASAAS